VCARECGAGGRVGVGTNVDRFFFSSDFQIGFVDWFFFPEVNDSNPDTLIIEVPVGRRKNSCRVVPVTFSEKLCN